MKKVTLAFPYTETLSDGTTKEHEADATLVLERPEANRLIHAGLARLAPAEEPATGAPKKGDKLEAWHGYASGLGFTDEQLDGLTKAQIGELVDTGTPGAPVATDTPPAGGDDPQEV